MHETLELPPLDPAVDYRKSTQELARPRSRWNHRSLDIPYWTAPAGYCRWCGSDLKRRLRSGGVDAQVRWHPECVKAYQRLYPAVQRRRVFRLAGGICRACGADCSRLQWAADHVVPLIDGGDNDDANLQLLCRACHADKTAREATARASVRRGWRSELASFYMPYPQGSAVVQRRQGEP